MTRENRDNSHDIYYEDVLIENGASESVVVSLKDNAIVGIETDTDFDGTSLTINMGSAADRVKTSSLDGAPVSVTISANQFAPVNPQVTLGPTHVKLVSSATQSGADTVVRLLLRAY